MKVILFFNNIIMKLWIKVFIGIAIGVVLGFILGPHTVYIKPIGDLFMRLIKMIVVPMIFFSIVGGITNVEDKETLGRLGIKATIVFIGTTIFALFIGFSVAFIFQPGHDTVLHLSRSFTSSPTSLASSLFNVLDFIPDNALAAMGRGNILQVVFFAFFTGFTILSLPQKQSEKISEAMLLMRSLVFRMVQIIVKLSPVAACVFISWIIGSQDSSTLKGVMNFYLCVVFACIVQYLIFGGMISVFAKVSPLPFFKKCLAFQGIAFATTSSKAALTTAIKTAQDKLGVSKSSSSFLIPMGASLNMDGLAIYLGIATLFIAQALGKSFDIYDYMMLILTSTLGAIGGAGIPGSAIVILPIVFNSVGLPVEAVAIIAGIDRLIGPFTTTTNITGDVAVTLCVDASEKTFDKKIYYS